MIKHGLAILRRRPRSRGSNGAAGFDASPPTAAHPTPPSFANDRLRVFLAVALVDPVPVLALGRIAVDPAQALAAQTTEVERRLAVSPCESARLVAVRL